MRTVVVLEEAADDLEAAREFYDEINPGIGEYCVNSLIADVQSLKTLHGIHPIHFDCFRMLARRFPFGIYYQESGAFARVIAILDLRRDPNWIRAEITRRR